MGFITQIATINNEKVYLAVGPATRDADFRMVGAKETKMSKWGMACGEKPDGSTRFVDCVAWSRVAPGAARIRKGDTVACIGKIQSREYQEKTYYELVCDWVGPMPSSVTGEAATPPEYTPMQDSPEGELPF